MSANPQKHTLMNITMIFLIIAAVVVLCLVKLPLPVRLAAATTDLIAAAIVFAANRQNRAG
ncbi:MAG TPA: hypothetical protein VIM44_04130 [Rariglobus sp.]